MRQQTDVVGVNFRKLANAIGFFDLTSSMNRAAQLRTVKVNGNGNRQHDEDGDGEDDRRTLHVRQRSGLQLNAP